MTHETHNKRIKISGVEATIEVIDDDTSGDDGHWGTLPIATRLSDRYRLLALVGSGGMGTVYRAHDEVLDEVVALKVRRRNLTKIPKMVERFRREVVLARRVTHKNVARVYDLGSHEEDRFFTMEFVDGSNLAQRLRDRGRLSLKPTIALSLQIAEGLRAAHAAGVIHRDLKPDNVLVDTEERVVITDFGVARAIMSGTLQSHTVEGSALGTPYLGLLDVLWAERCPLLVEVRDHPGFAGQLQALKDRAIQIRSVLTATQSGPVSGMD